MLFLDHPSNFRPDYPDFEPDTCRQWLKRAVTLQNIQILSFIHNCNRQKQIKMEIDRNMKWWVEDQFSKVNQTSQSLTHGLWRLIAFDNIHHWKMKEKLNEKILKQNWRLCRIMPLDIRIYLYLAPQSIFTHNL